MNPHNLSPGTCCTSIIVNCNPCDRTFESVWFWRTTRCVWMRTWSRDQAVLLLLHYLQCIEGLLLVVCSSVVRSNIVFLSIALQDTDIVQNHQASSAPEHWRVVEGWPMLRDLSVLAQPSFLIAPFLHHTAPSPNPSHPPSTESSLNTCKSNLKHSSDSWQQKSFETVFKESRWSRSWSPPQSPRTWVQASKLAPCQHRTMNIHAKPRKMLDKLLGDKGHIVHFTSQHQWNGNLKVWIKWGGRVPRDGVTSEKVSATNPSWSHKDLENKCGSVLYD